MNSRFVPDVFVVHLSRLVVRESAIYMIFSKSSSKYFTQVFWTESVCGFVALLHGWCIVEEFYMVSLDFLVSTILKMVFADRRHIVCR